MTFLIQQTLIYAIPLMIVALAGVFAERSGIINLALEGIMIFGAFIGVLFVREVQQLEVFQLAKQMDNYWALQGLELLAMAAAAIMGAATFFAEAVLRRVTSSNTIICLGALVIAVIVYAIFVLALQCITYEDCLLLPKGEKIAKILHIKHKT